MNSMPVPCPLLLVAVVVVLDVAEVVDGDAVGVRVVGALRRVSNAASPDLG